MPTEWRFAEYDPSTGNISHVAQVEFHDDAPETRGQFAARARARGRDTLFLAPGEALPDAAKQRVDQAGGRIVGKADVIAGEAKP